MADPLRAGGGLDAPLLLLSVVRAFTLLRLWPGRLQVIQKPVSSCSRRGAADHSARGTSAAAAVLGFAQLCRT